MIDLNQSPIDNLAEPSLKKKEMDGLTDFRYRAFISYPRLPYETEWALWLQSRIEQYKPPEDLAHIKPIDRVFVDDTELASTPNLSHSIREALRNSEWLIVICSPEVVNRRWVNEEIRFFSKELNRPDRIIPVLVAGKLEASLPLALQTHSEKDGGLSLEGSPLVIDLIKRGRTGKRRGLFQILAALLQCEFDELWRRHQERRKRRIAWGVAGAFLILAIICALALYARLQEEKRYTADIEANSQKLQREGAEKERKIAELRRARSDEAEKNSRFLAYYSRGTEAEQARELDIARLYYGTALSVIDRPEIRHKLSEVWDAPRMIWQYHFPVHKTTDVAAPPVLLLRKFVPQAWIVTEGGKIEIIDVDSGRRITGLALPRRAKAMVEHPDGNWVAIALEDGTILFVDSKLHVVKKINIGKKILSLAIDSETRFLAAGLVDDGVVFLDPSTGREKWKSPEGQHQRSVPAVAFAPKSPRALWSMGRYLYWTSPSDDHMGMVTALDDEIQTVAWSPNEETLAAAGLDGAIYINRSLLDNGSGVASELLGARRRAAPPFWNIPGHLGGTSSMQFTDNGQRLVSAGYDNAVRIWSVKNSELLFTLRGHSAPVLAVAVSKSGDKVISVAADGRVIAWATSAQGRLLWNNDLIGEQDKYSKEVGKFSPVGLLAISDNDVIMTLRDQSNWKIHLRDGAITQIAPSHGDSIGGVALFATTKAGAYAHVLPGLKGLDGLAGISSITLYDGEGRAQHWNVPGLVAAAPLDAKRWVVGLRSGSVEIRKRGGDGGLRVLTRNKPLIDVAASAQGFLVLWADGQLDSFDLMGIPSRTLTTQPQARTLQISPNGQLVAVTATGTNPVVRVIEISSGKTKFEMPLWARKATFSPDSKLLAFAAGFTESIVVVNISDFSVIGNLRYNGHQVSSLAFSQNGCSIISGGDEGTIRLWDITGMLHVLGAAKNELIKPTVEQAGMTLVGAGLHPWPSSGTGNAVYIPLTVPASGPAEQLTELIQQAKSATATDNDRIGRSLRKALQRCPTPENANSDMQAVCALAEITQSNFDIEAKDGLILNATTRADTASRTKNERLLGSVIPVLAELVDLFEDSAAENALHFSKLLVKTQEILINSNSKFAPSLMEYSVACQKLEQLLKSQGEEELINFYKLRSQFLVELRRRPDMVDLASQGYALFQFRLGRLFIHSQQLENAVQALSVADELYGQDVGRLVQTGAPTRNHAREMWANVIALRAGALTQLALQSRADVALDSARRQIERAVEQFSLLDEDERSTAQVRDALENLRKMNDKVLRAAQ